MARPFRILTINNIAAVGLKHFPSETYQVAGDITDPDAILVRSQDLHQMEIPRAVQAIARAGAGTNNIPVKRMSERGVPVFNAPGANANAVKELVIAGLLIAARNLAPAIRFVEGLRGDDASIDKQVEEAFRKKG
jgi:D-3-phosphoglycerate dehydrogenase